MLGCVAHFVYGGCNCSDGGGVVSIGVKRDRVAARVEEVLAGTAAMHLDVADAVVHEHAARSLAPVRPVDMGTCVYFLSWEFTYQVARPPMASVTTISSRYPLLNPNMGVTLLQKVACANALVRIVFVPRYSIMKQMIASKPSMDSARKIRN